MVSLPLPFRNQNKTLILNHRVLHTPESEYPVLTTDQKAFAVAFDGDDPVVLDIDPIFDVLSQVVLIDYKYFSLVIGNDQVILIKPSDI